MKIFKLLLIFGLLASGIFVALNWDSFFAGESSNVVKLNNPVDVDSAGNKIGADWAAQTAWNRSLYDKHFDRIEQWKKSNRIDETGYTALSNRLHSAAAKKVKEAYEEALKSESFSDGVLSQRFDAVKELKGIDKSYGNEAYILRVEKLHKLYNDIKNFAKSDHKVYPHFNTETGMWTSFVSARQAVLNTAKRYKEDDLYPEMKTVPGFKEALDEQNLVNLTNKYKTGFYEGLSSQIVTYFRDTISVPRTEVSKQLLNRIYTDVYSEADGKGVSELISFTRQYNNK